MYPAGNGLSGKAAEYIERLSRYMASNDRHYANHYATIKKWLDEDSKGRSAKNYTYDDNEESIYESDFYENG